MAKKELQSFSHCGSFDHPCMQSLNDYKISFFILRLRNQKFWGVWYTVGKVFWRSFQWCITSLKIPKLLVSKPRQTNLQLFSNCIAWWSKEPQWENDCGSFWPCFLLVIVCSPIYMLSTSIHYIDYPDWCMLLFGVMQCYNYTTTM